MLFEDLCLKINLWPLLYHLAKLKGLCNTQTTYFPFITLAPGASLGSTLSSTNFTFLPTGSQIAVSPTPSLPPTQILTLPPGFTTLSPIPTFQPTVPTLQTTQNFPTFPISPSTGQAAISTFPTTTAIPTIAPTFPTFPTFPTGPSATFPTFPTGTFSTFPTSPPATFPSGPFPTFPTAPPATFPTFPTGPTIIPTISPTVPTIPPTAGACPTFPILCLPGGISTNPPCPCIDPRFVAIQRFMDGLKQGRAQNCFDSGNATGTCTSFILCKELQNDYLKSKQNSGKNLTFSEFISDALCGFDGIDFLVCCASKQEKSFAVPSSAGSGAILSIATGSVGIAAGPVLSRPPDSSLFSFSPLQDNGSTQSSQIVAPVPGANNIGNKPTVSPPQNLVTRKPGSRYTLAMNDGVCGISIASQTKVVGGTEAKRGAYPWLAALGYQTLNGNVPGFYCGGSLITSRHVLTTAHCITPGLYMVRLGAHEINTYQTGTMDASIEKRIVHQQYDAASITNDVALLKLVNDVPITTYIRPICLPILEPWKSREITGYNAFVAGWGAVSFQGPVSPVVRDVQLPIVDVKTCEANYRVRFPTVTLDTRVLCAGYTNGERDACQGDSGGPLMLSEVTADRSNYYFYLVGIVSYGYECARAGFPGIYSRVTSFLPWIESKLNE